MEDADTEDRRFSDMDEDLEKHPSWIIVESILSLFILCGNVLTICAVLLSRRLARATSSQFVLSLAVSDILVGLLLPFHMSFYAGNDLIRSRLPCLFRLNLMVLAFCNSMFSLSCISLDRYMYILHPLRYSAYVTKRLARTVICVGWLYSITLALTTFFWNNWESACICDFALVVPVHFIMLVLTPHFAFIWCAMFVIYWRIWRVAATVLKQWGNSPGRPSDGKSIQVVLLVLGSFTILWLPFFVVLGMRFLCIACIAPDAYLVIYQVVLSLAMANSGVNPIIYAWKNAEFASAFSQLLRCRMPSNDRAITAAVPNGNPAAATP